MVLLLRVSRKRIYNDGVEWTLKLKIRSANKIKYKAKEDILNLETQKSIQKIIMVY